MSVWVKALLVVSVPCFHVAEPACCSHCCDCVRARDAEVMPLVAGARLGLGIDGPGGNSGAEVWCVSEGGGGLEV